MGFRNLRNNCNIVWGRKEITVGVFVGDGTIEAVVGCNRFSNDTIRIYFSVNESKCRHHYDDDDDPDVGRK